MLLRYVPLDLIYAFISARSHATPYDAAAMLLVMLLFSPRRRYCHALRYYA